MCYNLSVFDEVKKKVKEIFYLFDPDDWVEWIAQDNNWKDDCDKFNGCYFIVKQMPKYPYHPHCQCRLKKIPKPTPNVTATATCNIRKFTEYVFSEKYQDGKKELFESWGYNINDSEYLQNIFTSQAIQKYCNGDYVYKGTNDYSARIEIVIDITAKDGRTLHIKSGWILSPKGEINLTTPFSGFVN